MSRLTLIPLLVLASPLAAEPPTDQHGDPLPKGAVARLGTVRYRVGTVGPVALSPDGKTLAVEGSHGITFWDVDTGRPGLRIGITGHDINYPNCGPLAFTADGQIFVSVYRQELKAYDAKTCRLRFSVGLVRGGQRVSPIPGTTRFAVVDNEKTGLIIDAKDGRIISKITSEVPLLGLSPSGRWFLGSDDGVLVLVDLADGKIRSSYPNISGQPQLAFERKMVIMADDRRLYAIDRKYQLQTFDAHSGASLAVLNLPDVITAKGVSPDGLAISPDDTVIYLWRYNLATSRLDVKTGRWLEPLPSMPFGRLVPHPDGKRVLFVGIDGLLRRYDLATRREIAPPDGFVNDVTTAPSPDGKYVATASNEGRIDLFDSTGRLLWSVVPEHAQKGLSWTPESRSVVCVGSWEIDFRDATTGKVQRRLKLADVTRGYEKHALITAFGGPVQFTPASDLMVVPFGHCYDLRTRIAVIDNKTGQRTRMIQLGEEERMTLASDGRTLVARRSGKDTTFIDLVTGTSRGPFQDEKLIDDGWAAGLASAEIACSPDGAWLLTWDGPGKAVLRDPDTGRQGRTIDVHQKMVQAFSFSPDGLYLATGGDNGLVALWDVATGDQVWAEDGHSDRVTSLGFAGPRRLVTGSRDLTALVWDLRPDRKLPQTAWQALAGEQSRAAYQAIWAIADDPDGPALLRSKIAPVKHASAAQMQKWIADLGAPRYATRESATTALRDLGRRVEPELRTLRAKTTDDEVRNRLDSLLVNLPRERTAAERVNARAVAAMELAGTAEAKKLLAEWASGAAGARLTIDAKAALKRMGR
ncbi:MAG TPA: WD40 repeat domain-containing protein [Gemmataceae bacterium]|jgi:WD40 repeat protein|nr:WD40 repeat domain-containing protein [Gemmataceae bacterium]